MPKRKASEISGASDDQNISGLPQPDQVVFGQASWMSDRSAAVGTPNSKKLKISAEFSPGGTTLTNLTSPLGGRYALSEGPILGKGSFGKVRKYSKINGGQGCVVVKELHLPRLG